MHDLLAALQRIGGEEGIALHTEGPQQMLTVQGRPSGMLNGSAEQGLMRSGQTHRHGPCFHCCQHLL